jgi:hypothetical protein
LTVGNRENRTLAETLREQSLEDALPAPTIPFRRRAWLAFQRALDPLARPRPLRLPPRRPPL